MKRVSEVLKEGRCLYHGCGAELPTQAGLFEDPALDAGFCNRDHQERQLVERCPEHTVLLALVRMFDRAAPVTRGRLRGMYLERTAGDKIADRKMRRCCSELLTVYGQRVGECHEGYFWIRTPQEFQEVDRYLEKKEVGIRRRRRALRFACSEVFGQMELGRAA